LVALTTFVAAADALQLSWVTLGLARVVGYIPNVLAAALVVVAAYVLGRMAYRGIARRGEPNSPLWGRMAQGAIYVLAGFMALQQLHIASSIVTIAFVCVLGSLAVASAVSFGWGNRELAGRITREWYDRSRLSTRHFTVEEAEETAHPGGEEPPPLHH
jgi:hypothetical protein